MKLDRPVPVAVLGIDAALMRRRHYDSRPVTMRVTRVSRWTHRPPSPTGMRQSMIYRHTGLVFSVSPFDVKCSYIHPGERTTELLPSYSNLCFKILLCKYSDIGVRRRA